MQQRSGKGQETVLGYMILETEAWSGCSYKSIAKQSLFLCMSPCVLRGGKLQVRAYLQKPQVARRISLMTNTSVCSGEQQQTNLTVSKGDSHNTESEMPSFLTLFHTQSPCMYDMNLVLCVHSVNHDAIFTDSWCCCCSHNGFLLSFFQ